MQTQNLLFEIPTIVTFQRKPRPLPDFNLYYPGLGHERLLTTFAGFTHNYPAEPESQIVTIGPCSAKSTISLLSGYRSRDVLVSFGGADDLHVTHLFYRNLTDDEARLADGILGALVFTDTHPCKAPEMNSRVGQPE